MPVGKRGINATGLNEANAVRTDVAYSDKEWKEKAENFAKDICPFWGTKRTWDNIHSKEWKVSIVY
jgi:hypothetical protein